MTSGRTPQKVSILLRVSLEDVKLLLTSVVILATIMDTNVPGRLNAVLVMPFIIPVNLIIRQMYLHTVCNLIFLLYGTQYGIHVYLLR